MNGSWSPSAGAPTPAAGYMPTPSSTYTLGQSVLALVSFPLGYLFLRWIFDGGLSAFLYVWLVTLFVLGVLLVSHLPRKRRPRPVAVILLILNPLLAGIYLVSPPSSVTAVLTLWEILSFLLFCFYLFADPTETPLGDGSILDLIKAVFVHPVGACLKVFPAAVSLFRKQKAGRRLGMVLLGIGIAAIPSAIVIALLATGDAAFGRLMASIGERLFGSNPFEVITNIILFVYSFPFSMYLYGAVYAAWENRFPRILDRAGKEKVTAGAARIPVTVTVSAVLPFLLIYLLFFFSQLGYYVDAFAGMIPEGYTTADYARSGFFQLCAVSAMNLVLILLASLFSRRKEGKQSLPVRILSAVLSVFTLVLIATALRKMILYIGLYGFTRLRILTSVFMVFLALVFLFLILRQIRSTFNTVLATAIAGTALLGLLGFCDLDARIAQGNLLLYENGTLETCDVDAFYDLSYTAAPYAIPLLEDEDPQLARAARHYLSDVAAFLEAEMAGDEAWHQALPARARVYEAVCEALGRVSANS